MVLFILGKEIFFETSAIYFIYFLLILYLFIFIYFLFIYLVRTDDEDLKLFLTTIINPFFPTVPKCAVRETASLGIMGARVGHKWVGIRWA